MTEPPILNIKERALDKDGTITIDGVLYASGGALSRLLGVKQWNLDRFAKRGMPFARMLSGPHRVYPVEACREWLANNNNGVKYISKITLDGKLHYSAKLLAECSGFHLTTIVMWADKYGMPTREYRGCRLYPLMDCLTWIKEYQSKSKEQKFKVRSDCDMMQRKSICNNCDNAYAHKCSWFRDYTPVDGWDAHETVYTTHPQTLMTYNVYSCPNFAPDPPRKETCY